jgi:hypothetical protein
MPADTFGEPFALQLPASAHPASDDYGEGDKGENDGYDEDDHQNGGHVARLPNRGFMRNRLGALEANFSSRRCRAGLSTAR